MNAASASIRVDRLARLAGLDYDVVARLLSRCRMLRFRRGQTYVLYADIAALAPDLYHTLAFLLPALRKTTGRPRGFLGDKAKPGRKAN